MKEQLMTSVSKLKIAEKMKELQATLQRLKASLQSIAKKDDNQNHSE